MSTARSYTLGLHLFLLLLALFLLSSLLKSQCWHQDWNRSFSSALPPTAWTSNLRLGSTPLPKKKNDILPGVSVFRSFIVFPDTAKVVLDVDGENCQERDEYGDNECHWDWGAKLGANVHGVFNQPIQQDDYVEGHVRIDGFIPYKFRCPLCGQDCILSIPVVKANFTIPTSDHCPIPVGQHSKRIVGHLWANSPTDGKITTSLEATIAAIQGSTGKTLVEVKLSAHVK